ncbi:hypothetical protein HMPREF6745_0006 [Prevotella sp. oral taxon 472 str. F0295]|nr:hypothetical protein HMPREF6745_0006 [Prevotella sp. oral taxon 472 str. F0295]
MNEFLFMKILKKVMLLLKDSWRLSEVVDLYKLQGELNMIL